MRSGKGQKPTHNGDEKRDALVYSGSGDTCPVLSLPQAHEGIVAAGDEISAGWHGIESQNAAAVKYRRSESVPSARIEVENRHWHSADIDGVYGLVGRERCDPQLTFDARDEERVVMRKEEFVRLLREERNMSGACSTRERAQDADPAPQGKARRSRLSPCLFAARLSALRHRPRPPCRSDFR